MVKSTSPEQAQLEVFQKSRLQFLELLAGNPNYFGTLKSSGFQPVFPLANDTFYEEVTCLGFNPHTNVLEAVVQVKQASGYSGSLCQTGSYEYVRFFVDYGSGWEDAGVAAVNVHDIPEATDCHKDAEKPLSYAASVVLAPKSNWCFFPVLPKVRAILSWNSIPTPGDPAFTPIWGNILDAEIQIQPRPFFLGEVAATLNEVVKLVVPPEELQQALQIPIPLPDPPSLSLAQLASLYTPKTAGALSASASTTASAVPSHRYGFAELHQSLKAKAADPAAVELNIANWKNLGLDWPLAIASLNEVDANVTYEQLECLGTRGRLRTGAPGCDLCHQAARWLWRRALHGRQHRIRRLLGGLG